MPNEESELAMQRMSKFLILLDIYFEMIKGNVNHPRVNNWVGVLIEIIYAYFYSILDDRDDSINMFRLWKAEYPDHLLEIQRIENLVRPHIQLFRLFRHNVGFHGSTSIKGFDSGMKLFKEVDGDTTLNLMISVRNLSTHLLSLKEENQSRFPKYLCSICK